TLPNEVAQETAGLRGSISQYIVNSRPPAEVERIRPAVRVGAITAQKCDQVAHRRKSQAHHNRVTCRIDKFVNRAGIEIRRPADFNPVMRFKAPMLGWQHRPRILLALTNSQRGSSLVKRSRWVAQGYPHRIMRVLEDKFVAAGCNDRGAALSCDWQ